MKSFQPKSHDAADAKARPPRLQCRSRVPRRAALERPYASITDPDARLFRKNLGAGAMLCVLGHTFMDSRNGFIVEADLTRDAGHYPAPRARVDAQANP